MRIAKVTTSWESDRIRRAIIPVAVWVLSVGYIATLIDRGWGPPDEGLLGHSAERLLAGELPHRDFDELYTGGVSALHALAFKLFGVRLVSMRLMLFAAVLAWVPVFYALARRFASPLLAGAVTLLAVVWSVPAYPAPMPSWYNLFLASAGLLAVFRYLETDNHAWLFIAGLCGGVSILAKISGIFFVGAGAAVIIYHALPRATAMAVGERSRHGTYLAILLAAALSGALIAAIGAGRGLGTLVQLVLPVAVVTILLGVTARRSERVAWNPLLRAMFSLASGVAAVLLPFAAVYIWHDALPDLVNGVFVLPSRRIELASQGPRAGAIVWTAPLLVISAIGLRIQRRRTAAFFAALMLAVGAWLVTAGVRYPFYGGVGGGGPVYRPVVDSVASILPVLAMLFTVIALRWTGQSARGAGHSHSFAAVTVAAFCALIAFPFSNDLYFHYVAPLIALAVLATFSASGWSMDRRVVAAAIMVYLVFGVTRVAVNPSARLVIERGGIRVPPGDSAEVEAFVSTLRAHARNGYTFATPDTPEAYFLTGLRNPTRIMYEFLSSSDASTDRVLDALDEHQVTAVAISNWTIFSPRPDPRLLAALAARYPDSARVWHYTVRWNDFR